MPTKRGVAAGAAAGGRLISMVTVDRMHHRWSGQLHAELDDPLRLDVLASPRDHRRNGGEMGRPGREVGRNCLSGGCRHGDIDPSTHAACVSHDRYRCRGSGFMFADRADRMPGSIRKTVALRRISFAIRGCHRPRRQIDGARYVAVSLRNHDGQRGLPITRSACGRHGHICSSPPIEWALALSLNSERRNLGNPIQWSGLCVARP